MPKGVEQLLPILVLVFLAYLLLIRPARKRAREVSDLQSALSTGDEVMLTSGIFGRVEAIIDDKMAIEISPGVVVTVHRGAIGKIVRDVPADVEPDRETADDSPSSEPTDTSTPLDTVDGDPGLRDADETGGDKNRGAI